MTQPCRGLNMLRRWRPRSITARVGTAKLVHSLYVCCTTLLNLLSNAAFVLLSASRSLICRRRRRRAHFSSLVRFNLLKSVLEYTKSSSVHLSVSRAVGLLQRYALHSQRRRGRGDRRSSFCLDYEHLQLLALSAARCLLCIIVQ